jgi:hypothetical protein
MRFFDRGAYFVPEYVAEKEEQDPLYNSDAFREAWRGVLRADEGKARFVDFVMRMAVVALCRKVGAHHASSVMGICAIDNRANALTALSLAMAVANCGSSRAGSVVVYTHGAATAAWYRKSLEGWMADRGWRLRVFKSDRLDPCGFDIGVYNEFMKSAATWRHLGKFMQHALLVQDDGVLLFPGIEDLLLHEHEFAGAPWSSANEFNQQVLQPLLPGKQLVGNGGLSFRSTAAMRRICGELDANAAFGIHAAAEMPEDVWFATRAECAPRELCLRFAGEQVLQGVPLGVHKIWPYHGSSIVREFYTKCLRKAIEAAA